MTIRVTITKPGVTDAYGLPMVVGTTYTVEDNFGLSLISQGRASDTDDFLEEPINAPFVDVADPVGLSANGTSLVSGDRTIGTPSLLLVSTAAIASVTGTITETALRTVAIPDGAMGPNSRLIIRPAWQYTNSANNKVLAVKFGTTLGGATTLYTRTRTTTNAESPLIELVNRGAVNSQVVLYGQTGTYSTAQSANNATTTYDFATSGTNVYVVGTLANTGETIQVDSLWVEIVSPYV